MACNQLGGACDKEFRAETFSEIAAMSKQHAVEMLQSNDEAHLEAMSKMRDLMQTPGAMEDWFERKKKEFEALPDT